MIKYRIKTEQEMIDTLGKRWRSTIKAGWGSSMDYLFGKPLTNDPPSTIFSINDFGWNITDQMVVPMDEESAEKYFKERKKIDGIKSKFKIIEKAEGSYYELTYNGDYGFTIHIYQGPTGNCQLGSICYLNYLLDRVKKEDIKDYFQIIQEILSGKINKRIFLIDVKNCDRYNELLTPFVISGLTPYKSTNNSDMMIGIIKLI